MARPAVVPPMGRLLKAAAVAEFLGVTTSKVRKLIARGELTAIRNRNGRLEGVYEADAQAWIDERRRQAVRPAHDRRAVDERIEALMPKERHFEG